MTSFNLNHLPKSPVSSSESHIGVAASAREFWETRFSL